MAASDPPWWSLQPVVRPPVPGGDLGGANPIDRSLEADRTTRGVRAKPPADRRTLLRRVHLDLVGIPPTPAEQEAFLADEAPGAYERVVDRLLADEQHAVRYARHWLDVLRYADADERMTAAPGIHLWRDWVIRALHDDLPYDQFVQLQLTGRRSTERTQMSATGHRSQRAPRPGDLFALGFLARGAGSDPHELAMNAVDTVSGAFLGMTVACAKCHDHRFDPVSQSEYYSMKALFDPLVLREVTLAPAADLVAAGRARAELERLRAPLERERDSLLEPYRRRLHDERVAMLPPEVQSVVRKPERERSVAEQKVADDYFPILRIDDDKVDEVLSPEVRQRARDLRRRIDEASRDIPAAKGPVIPVFHTVETDPERARQPRHVLTSADPERPETGRPVSPGWPLARGPHDFREGRVEAFADWLTSPGNPRFARVAVNRLWQWHFGEGLHREPSDFGRQAANPTTPDCSTGWPRSWSGAASACGTSTASSSPRRPTGWPRRPRPPTRRTTRATRRTEACGDARCAGSRPRRCGTAGTRPQAGLTSRSGGPPSIRSTVAPGPGRTPRPPPGPRQRPRRDTGGART